jgi:hypothetical protein
MVHVQRSFKSRSTSNKSSIERRGELKWNNPARRFN